MPGQLHVMDFLSPAHEERLEHWAYGIKDTKVLGLLNDVGIY